MTLDDHIDALRVCTEPDPGRIRRIRRGRPPRPRHWTSVALVTAAAGVAAAIWLWPSQDESVQRSFAGVTAEALGPHVRVRGDGVGEVSGDTKELALSWRAGSLSVEVDPDRGVALQIVTAEAVVRVVGTAFDVTRDALGTQVAVSRGEVSVSCGDEAARPLRAGQSHACLPVDAAGWLRRVTALQEAARHREVVSGVRDALRLDPPAEIVLELRLHRLAAWRALGETGPLEAERAALLRDAPQERDRVEAAAPSNR